MRRPAIAVLSLLAAASVASCGDDDTAAGVATTAASTSAETLAPTPAPADETAPATTVVATEPSSPATEPVATTEPAATGESPTTTGDDGDRVVTSFAEVGSIEGWSNVDDTVMGGVSASTTTWEDGRMVFAGDLSLENNGGFTSVRSPQDVALGSSLDGAAAIGVVAEGDGKTYVLQLRTADDRLYIARFVTVGGEEQRYELPWREFEPVTRFLDPDPGSPPLVPSTVAQLAIYLLDGQVGPFRLAVRAIDAVAPTAI